MHITMLEPLGIGTDEVLSRAEALTDAGHAFTLCEAPLAREEKAARLRDAQIAVIANSPLDAALLAGAPDLRMLSVAFTGVDHVDMAVCRDRGITVCNAQGYCTDAVAELTFGLILALLRRIPQGHAASVSGGTRAGILGQELRGKTIGLLGTGAIARRVAQIAHVFGCPVIGYSRHMDSATRQAGIEPATLDALFAQSDILSLHVPLTDETHHIVNAQRLAAMKPGALLVNTARGAIVDSAALADALNNGRLAGAGIDVLEQEPPFAADHPLLHAKNAIVQPHVAFFTEQSLLRRADMVFENISAFLGGAPANVCK